MIKLTRRNEIRSAKIAKVSTIAVIRIHLDVSFGFFVRMLIVAAAVLPWKIADIRPTTPMGRQARKRSEP